MATVEPERILKVVQPFARRLVATVGKPAPGLEKRGWPEKAIPVPPVARASRGATETQNAFIVAIESSALLSGLEMLLFRFRCFRMKPRLDHLVLRKYVHEVWDQVLMIRMFARG
jgi:hypothetical protein